MATSNADAVAAMRRSLEELAENLDLTMDDMVEAIHAAAAAAAASGGGTAGAAAAGTSFGKALGGAVALAGLRPSVSARKPPSYAKPAAKVKPAPPPMPPPPATAPGRRVYVRNLAYSVTWQELKDHMRQAGRVLHSEIMPAPGTRMGSKGCALVEYATAVDARRAIEELTGSELRGRPIYVREDRDERRPGAPWPGDTDEGVEEQGEEVAEDEEAAEDVGVSDDEGVGDDDGGDIGDDDVVDDDGCVVDDGDDTADGGRRKRRRRRRVKGVSGGKGGGRGEADGDDDGGGVLVRRAAAPWLQDPAAAEGRGGCAVYVGNVSYDVTWQALKDHMRAAGNVTHVDIMSAPGAARHKGCAIVKYATPWDARRAIRELTDSVLDGRPIFVREDREADDGAGEVAEAASRGGGNGLVISSGVKRPRSALGGKGGGRPGCRVFVRNLPLGAKWQDLKDHMRQAGEVLKADILAKPGAKGCGLVEYATPEDAENAVEIMHETDLGGRQIHCRMERQL